MLKAHLILLFLSLCLSSCSKFNPRAQPSDTPLELAAKVYESSDLTSARTLAKQHDLSSLPQEAFYVGSVLVDDASHPEYQQLGVRLLIKAAQQGNDEAMLRLTEVYEEGLGAPTDPLKAMDWYREYRQSQGDGQLPVTFYEDKQGKLIKQTPEEIVKSVELSALEGDADSQNRLAALYEAGAFVDQSDAKAFEWYQKAASQGNENAQVMTGYYHCRGIRTKPDSELANTWLAKSGKTFKCTENRD